MIKKKPRFLRKDTFKKSRLGKRKKKKQIWRRPIGRHSKIREKRRGYGKQPSIGYSSPRKIRGSMRGLKPVLIYSPKDINEIKKNEIVIVGKVGKKRKIDIAKKALEKKIILSNLNAQKFIRKIEAEKKKKEELRKKRKVEEKKKEEKKTKETKEVKKEEKKEEKEKGKILRKETKKEKPEVKIKPKGGPKEKKEMFRKALEK
ncbi:MAG: hypothetical protein IB618_02635 [Candidatus Pacearchaeota archaeon]|nr:MAG: hypothetical protein IB618_02635 [Candidatus Pacearchaeota archaeon]